jgi:hypothetical protein
VELISGLGNQRVRRCSSGLRAWSRLATTVALATIVSLVASACGVSGAGSPQSVTAHTSGQLAARITYLGSAKTVRVSPQTGVSVRLRSVATITGSPGTVDGTGTATITPVSVSFTDGPGLTSAGTGIEVTFHGARLVKPLEVTFATQAKPLADSYPVLAHQTDDGTWTLTPARLDEAGHIQIGTQSFSVNIPGWFNPKKWVSWFGSRIASVIGGRTSPISCPGGAPKWAQLVSGTNTVHTCLTSAIDSLSRSTKAEVQIKSNRAGALQITVPPDEDSTEVDEPSFELFKTLWDTIFHQGSDSMLLPAGRTLTTIHSQPQFDEDLTFEVQVTADSLFYSIIGALIDTFAGEAADKLGAYTAIFYFISKCAGVVDYQSLAITNPPTSQTFGSALGCLVAEATTALRDTNSAVQAASKVFGRYVDSHEFNAAVQRLVTAGRALKGMGWVVQLWPLIQMAWSDVADSLTARLTGGTSQIIHFDLKGSSPPAPTAPPVAATPAPVSSGKIEIWQCVAATAVQQVGLPPPAPSPACRAINGDAAPWRADTGSYLTPQTDPADCPAASLANILDMNPNELADGTPLADYQGFDANWNPVEYNGACPGSGR